MVFQYNTLQNAGLRLTHDDQPQLVHWLRAPAGARHVAFVYKRPRHASAERYSLSLTVHSYYCHQDRRRMAGVNDPTAICCRDESTDGLWKRMYVVQPETEINYEHGKMESSTVADMFPGI